MFTRWQVSFLKEIIDYSDDDNDNDDDDDDAPYIGLTPLSCRLFSFQLMRNCPR